MENFKVCEIIFDDEELKVIVTSLNTIFRHEQEEFVHLCYYFSRLKDYFKSKGKYYLVSGHIKKDNTIKCTYLDIIKQFGYEEKTVNKFVQCVDKFFEKKLAGAPEMERAFLPFTRAKLFELLPLSKETIIQNIESGALKPDMTKKEIREFVKYIKGKEKKDNNVAEELEDEEDIPETFDEKKEYTFEYFTKLSKQQLIDISWRLYQLSKKSNKK